MESWWAGGLVGRYEKRMEMGDSSAALKKI